MRITVAIVHKSQLPQLFTNRKWQMAPSICIGGNGGICEQLRFVNNEVIDKGIRRFLIVHKLSMPSLSTNNNENPFWCEARLGRQPSMG